MKFIKNGSVDVVNNATGTAVTLTSSTTKRTVTAVRTPLISQLYVRVWKNQTLVAEGESVKFGSFYASATLAYAEIQLDTVVEVGESLRVDLYNKTGSSRTADEVTVAYEE